MERFAKLLITSYLIGFGLTIQAQNTIPVTGGNATGTGGSVSYSIGQIVFNVITGTNSSVTQGVQQPYEISIVTSIENAKEIILECIVYPNPTRSIIKLSIETLEFENIKFKLFDLNGMLIQDKKVENKETEISMENLVPSTYFLRVIKDKKEVKTFKVIKN